MPSWASLNDGDDRYASASSSDDGHVRSGYEVLSPLLVLRRGGVYIYYLTYIAGWHANLLVGHRFEAFLTKKGPMCAPSSRVCHESAASLQGLAF